MISVENPDIVDVNSGKYATIVLNDENIVINVTSEGIILDFWLDGSDGDPHGTIGMTFEEWRTFATRRPATDPIVEKYYGGVNPF